MFKKKPLPNFSFKLRKDKSFNSNSLTHTTTTNKYPQHYYYKVNFVTTISTTYHDWPMSIIMPTTATSSVFEQHCHPLNIVIHDHNSSQPHSFPWLTHYYSYHHSSLLPQPHQLRHDKSTNITSSPSLVSYLHCPVHHRINLNSEYLFV